MCVSVCVHIPMHERMGVKHGLCMLNGHMRAGTCAQDMQTRDRVCMLKKMSILQVHENAYKV